MTAEWDIVRAAARNNADLCDAVARAHGLVGTFATDAWTSTSRTPPLYPDAVTLVPDVDAVVLLDRIDTAAGASVKDSFSSLDLRPHGFDVLFDAEWIHRPAPPPVDPPPEIQWSVPEAGDGLVEFHGVSAGAIVGHGWANRSEQVVGLANVEAASVDVEAAVWAGLAQVVAARFPGLDLVGYESGHDLELARAAGFRSIGPLRIWIKE